MPLYFNYYNISLNGIVINELELFQAEIPFFKFMLNDPHDSGVSTPVEDMTVTMIYKFNTEVVTEIQLSPIEDSDNEFIIPLVTEYLGDFYNCTDEDIHTITVETQDAAGNSTTKIFSFKAYVDAPELTINSLNQLSTVSVNAWDDGIKGELLSVSATNKDGVATIKMFSDQRPVLVELTQGRYRELANGAYVKLEDGRSLQAVINFIKEDISLTVSPLTHVAAALAGRELGRGRQWKRLRPPMKPYQIFTVSI